MANINSLYSSTSNSYGTSNSLYGNRNILTGLASGLDTETMIQNSVYAYQQKILSLQQSQTKITWKQDAFRDIIDQMNSIIQKYTSYTSKTNLASNAFFSNARRTESVGKNAGAISATGVAKSDIQIDAVTQLATSARYTVDASALGVNVADKAEGTAIKWDETRTVGQVKGTMTLTYGTQKIELKFDENDNDIDTAEGLKAAIEKKLADVSIKAKDGSSVKASTLIGVEMNGQNFTFVPKTEDKTKYDGSSIYISGLSGNVASKLGAQRASSSADEKRFDYNGFTVSGNMKDLVKTQSMAEYLSGKTVSVTVDGVTKTITIGDLTNVELSQETKAAIAPFDEKITEFNGKIAGVDAQILALQEEIDAMDPDAEGLTDKLDQMGELRKQRMLYAAEVERFEAAKESVINGDVNKALKSDLQASIDKAFGKGKVTIGDSANGGLQFSVAEGSMIRVSSEAGDALGIGWNGVSNYLSTTSTLLNLVGEKDLNAFARIQAKGDPSNFTMVDGKYYDEAGKLVTGELVNGKPAGQWYRVDEDGNSLYSLEINGVQIGEFTKDTTLESVITAINSNTEAGVKVNYSNLTGQFVFTANETGSGGEITFGEGLAQRLFKSKDGTGEEFTSGQDAEIYATVNGKSLKLTRSSNTFDMDGMTVTLKDKFNTVTEKEGGGYEIEGESVTFKSSSDSDTVVDTIKTFVEDINNLLKSIHDAYSTMPLKNSSSSSSGYEPLTDEDKASMSESAIKAYEEKAKTGILFGDTDLSQLYNRLLSAIQASGADRMDMEAIGLTTSYSNGLTQLTLDEDKLRAALDSDPDKVRNVFTKTVDGGSKTNGLMAAIKIPLNNYGSTSLGSPGILVSKAGTKLSAISLMNNNLQKQIDNIDKQIESWQSKLSDKVDFYTRQFSLLEQLMSTMNNQSSMLASMMGGY